MAAAYADIGLLIVAAFALVAAILLLLRRNDRLRPGIDRAVRRWWDTEEHSKAWEEEERERRDGRT